MSTHFLERSHPFDLLFRNLFDTETTFVPALEAKQQHPIDIFEDDLGLTFEVACTGISKEAIEIKLEGDLISFNYDKKKSPDVQNRNYIHQGVAKRSFHLGYKVGTKYQLSKAKASFRDGLLIVSIPFAEEAKPKVLKIN
jgi:HSP20 family protein|tara:strand:- start:27 stop:446 length:420 start_codon:yes stop_codon:yes gene_type:complete